MKVKLQKNHPLGNEGDEVEVDEAQANYLNRVGVISLSKKKAEKVEAAIIEPPMGEKEEKTATDRTTKEEKEVKAITTKSIKHS